jgi:hypothetical protein
MRSKLRGRQCVAWTVLFIFSTLPGLACKHPNEQSLVRAENAASRKIIGEGVPLKAIEGIDLDRMKGSMGYRRAIAWKVLAAMLRPIKVAVPSSQISPEQQTVPVWRTWYEHGEILNMFDAAYYRLSDEQAKKRAPICESDVAGAFKGLLGRDLADYGVSPEDFQTKLSQFRGHPDVEGIPGTGFTMFSPAVAAHYLRNYKEIIECGEHPRLEAPPSALTHSACMVSEFPNGLTKSAAYADKAIRDFSHCQGPQDQFDERDLGMAVAIKASWFPVRSDSKIAVFDTSAEGMKRYLNEGEFLPVDTKDANDAVFQDIYSVRTRANVNSDKTVDYGMAAAHFAIKQFPDWLWITLWWSPDPNSDFGEDRPDSIQGIWRNYKMCVVADYQDTKYSMDEEFRRKFPELTASLDETFNNPNTNTANSWCSNPYIERRRFNARTNCIGCHQHAGAGAVADQIFQGDEANFPHSARSKVRNNFISDYLFSFDQNPDQFQHEMDEIVRSRESSF